MNNMYKEFFELLREHLLQLEIDKKHHGVERCSIEEVRQLEEKTGKLPLAYKEYLLSMGRTYLFEFMDAECMSFLDLDYAQEFGKEVFEKNKLRIERTHLVISERRNEYITFIYLDEGDNPETWIMSEYWGEGKGENLASRTKTFTELITVFFQRALRNFPYTFNWVTEEEKKKDEDIVEKRYMNWFRNLNTVAKRIEASQSDNELVKDFNKKFLEYYNLGKDNRNKMLSEYENKS